MKKQNIEDNSELVREYQWTKVTNPGETGEPGLPEQRYVSTFFEIRFHRSSRTMVSGEVYCYEKGHDHAEFPQKIDHIQAENINQIRLSAFEIYHNHIKETEDFLIYD